jgi:Ca2+-transporting ATPase
VSETLATLTQEVDLRTVRGLSRAQAARRLTAEGYNELPAARPRSLLAIAAGVLHEPMILLLVAAGTLYLFLGDLAEALLLIGSIFLIVGINLYQERRTERALEALRDLSSPRARVIRDGEQVRVPGREVVRGDVLVLAEGDRVPADAVLLASVNLSADESLLTGESVPVRKAAGTRGMAMAPPGGDDRPFVYSGTLVVRGQGVGQVQAVGAQTAIGRIGKALQTVQVEQTRVQRETRRMVQALAAVAFVLCLLVAVVYGLTRADWVGCSRGSRWPWPSSRRNSRSCSPSSWDSAPGASRGSVCSRAGCRPWRCSAQPRCSAWTRPARSPSTR